MLMAKKTAVYGIFRDRVGVEMAVDRLKVAGFKAKDVSALFPYDETTKDFAIEKETKAPEGATTGAGTGAVIGGVLGWLTGAGLMTIPGIGPVLAAGPLATSLLAGIGLGGAIGGIAGALIGMGVPEYEANRYEGMVKEGGILLSVHTEDSAWSDKAKDILKQAGAIDVASKSEAHA
jgi:hypothetical protein